MHFTCLWECFFGHNDILQGVAFAFVHLRSRFSHHNCVRFLIVFCFFLAFMKGECSITQVGQICLTVKQYFFEEGTMSKSTYHLGWKTGNPVGKSNGLPHSVFGKLQKTSALC